MTAHSPGPWQRCSANDGRCTCGLVWDASGQFLVALVVRSDEDHDKPAEIAVANARLVVAAPEMLDMIQDGLGWDGVEPRWRREAEALIARIKGSP